MNSFYKWRSELKYEICVIYYLALHVYWKVYHLRRACSEFNQGTMHAWYWSESVENWITVVLGVGQRQFAVDMIICTLLYISRKKFPLHACTHVLWWLPKLILFKLTCSDTGLTHWQESIHLRKVKHVTEFSPIK